MDSAKADGALQSADDSFIRTKPAAISKAAQMRMRLNCSPMSAMPITNAPIAPMPVQIIYAVPRGRVRIDAASRAKLMTMPSTVIIDGIGLVKPFDCFIAKAQTISKIPAATSIIQAISAPLKEPGRPGHEFPMWGRPLLRY